MKSPAITHNSTTRKYNSPPPETLIRPLTSSPIVQVKPDHFAAALAHEIRNPLVNINLAVGMLKLANRDDNQVKYMDIIMRSSVRINDLLKEFLKYQQADQLRLEKQSICHLLDEVLEMSKDRIKLKNISIKKEYYAMDWKIMVNKPKMKIALTNIIINAIDAMGPEKGELKVATKVIDKRYALQIEDNGCGISKGDLKYIFKPNYTNKPEGLGLGLAATYEILRSNNVGINVESEKGRGTKFILFFDENYHYMLINP